MKTLYLKTDEFSETVLYIDYDSWDSRLKNIFKNYSDTTHFPGTEMVEYGPILRFRSPFSTNVSNILDSVGITGVNRVEQTTRISKTHFNVDDIDPVVQVIYDRKITSFDMSDSVQPLHNKIIPIEEIFEFGKCHGLAFDEDDIDYYTNLFKNKIGRNPTSTELYDLSQGNSEHSRHWFFTGKMVIDGVENGMSLLDKIREPLKKIRERSFAHDVSIVAFSDNASASRNYITTTHLVQSNPLKGSKLMKKYHLFHPTLTAETHNFPTGIAPFQGAETGVGGRIRDTQAIGKGGIPLAGLAGYCVGDLKSDIPSRHSAMSILYKASDGASDYGNKFGEPLIGGFCRSFGDDIGDEYREWLKPIMFSAGVGLVHDNTYIKDTPEVGMNIVKLGGPAYRIGIGGGSASSRAGGGDDVAAVQRGDAEMENRLNRVIRTLVELGSENPIRVIHDQGAGGTSNVTKEIVEPFGSIIDLDAVVCGDDTMTPLEIWIAEYQEQNTILIDEENIHILKSLCKRERVPFAIIGKIMNRKNVTVKSSKCKGDGITEEKPDIILDLPIKEVLSDIGKKTYNLDSIEYKSSFKTLHLTQDKYEDYILDVLKLPSVCSKHFLTSKVDRSVGGLVVRGQCVGPFHTPISNFSITATSFYNKIGTVTSIGEQPLKGFHNPKNMVNMSIGEMLTNMIGAYVGDISNIRCSGNWMWANDDNKNRMMLNDAVNEVKKTMIKLGIAVDGGKDSLSMSQNVDGRRIRSPNEFVVTGYATMRNIQTHLTPEFKVPGNHIVYIDLGRGKYRVGGSALTQVLGDYDYEMPNFEYLERFPNIFNRIQMLILNKQIVSLHDRSDGGLITTLIEMGIASNLGFDLHVVDSCDLYEYSFAEELGLVVEVQNFEYINRLIGHMVPVHKIGVITPEPRFKMKYNTVEVLDMSISKARVAWESTSFDVLERMTDKKAVCAERSYVNTPDNFMLHPQYKTSFSVNIPCDLKGGYTVGIIREEGSNGDREMAFAFHDAGFVVYDLNMRDILKNPTILHSLRGVIFVGGFSYADALGAGVGWSAAILSNPKLSREFEVFKNRPNTFSLGVCNGCQLMTNLGWVDGHMERNNSKRFESRYSTVRIENTNSILLDGMDDGVLGVWVAHGEGRFTGLSSKTQVPIHYTDNAGKISTEYPLNPNGSERAAAAVVSTDGRHLAMMPHPERCILTWQNPFVPYKWSDNKYYPWRRMFVNAYVFCDKN